MEWCPQQAMEAYLNTLELSKMSRYEDCTMGPSKPIEPECMELVSALAAGNRAKLMVEITSGGITPFTIALAVAAKQTGGRLICILPPSQSQSQSHVPTCDETLKDMIEFVVGNPSEVIKKYRRVEFMVVDSTAINGDGGLQQLKLWENLEVNPKGCVVVATNLLHEGKKGFTQCVTVPIGNGVELTKIRSLGKNWRTQRFKRFHVTFENY